MRLPTGPLHKMVDKDSKRGLDRIVVAFRHGYLFCYVTNGHICARVAMDITQDELKQLEDLVKASCNHKKAGLLVDHKVFRELQKAQGPCCIVKTEAQWMLRHYSGTCYPVDLDPDSRVVEMIESVFDMEKGRTELGTLAFNPDSVVLCRDAIGYDEIVPLEIGVDVAGGPLIVRKRQDIAMVMPASDNETPGIKALIDAAHEVFTMGRHTVGELAELIFKTFGVKHAETSKVEDSTPGQ